MAAKPDGALRQRNTKRPAGMPPAPADVSEVAAPQLHLPAQLATDNRRYLFWSTDGLPEIINGRSSVQPEYTQAVVDGMATFPDRDSVALMRAQGT